MQNATNPTVRLIDNTHYHRLPDALLEGRRFRNWMWLYNREKQEFAKYPLHHAFGGRFPDEKNGGKIRYFGMSTAPKN